jgi:hypothetical protein
VAERATLEPVQRIGRNDLLKVVREAMAKSRLAGQELPANGRESPGSPDYGGHIDGETASRDSIRLPIHAFAATTTASGSEPNRLPSTSRPL